MELSKLFKNAERVVTNNSPAILTGIGAAGTLITAYLTGKATVKALNMLAEERRHIPYERDPKEKVMLVWKCYIPPAITATMTVTAIVFANRIGTRRTAALAAAYSLSERAMEEYREKVVEKLGEKKEKEIQAELAQDKVTNNPPNQVVLLGRKSNSVLCYDGYTGRYFLSDMESLRRAQNDINQQIINDMYASLTDFYELIGLEPTDMSNDLGWNVDKMLDLSFTTTMSELNEPCIVLHFTTVPIRNYSLGR